MDFSIDLSETAYRRILLRHRKRRLSMPSRRVMENLKSLTRQLSVIEEADKGPDADIPCSSVFDVVDEVQEDTGGTDEEQVAKRRKLVSSVCSFVVKLTGQDDTLSSEVPFSNDRERRNVWLAIVRIMGTRVIGRAARE